MMGVGWFLAIPFQVMAGKYGKLDYYTGEDEI